MSGTTETSAVIVSVWLSDATAAQERPGPISENQRPPVEYLDRSEGNEYFIDLLL